MYGRETNGFLGLFSGVKWDTVQGFVILPEFRQTAIAIVGFYSAQVKYGNDDKTRDRRRGIKTLPGERQKNNRESDL
jgi:hypothetical protein